MKKIHSSIALFLFLFILVSCKKDFLETPPTSNVSKQQHITDLQGCADLMNGAYIDLSASFYHGYNFIYPDLVADNIRPEPGRSAFNAMYGWTQIANETQAAEPNANHTNMNALWTAGYRIIRNCCYLLENTDKFRSQGAAQADDIKGQALALRAFIHFQLLQVFAQPYGFTADASHAGIPYVLVSDYTQPVKRASVAMVYKQVIEDLTAALTLLDQDRNSIITINANAAKALLSRVCLFKGDYVAAKNWALPVIHTVPLLTGEHYLSKLFATNQPAETEVLLQMPPSSAGYTTTFSSFYFRANEQFIATTDIVRILSERPLDLRNAWISFSSGSWSITKFPVGVAPGISNTANAYYPSLIRCSELYLTAAESYASLSRPDSAVFYLDAVRRRADDTAVPTTATGAALLDSIAKERRKEFCFEGQRMFHLLRLGKEVFREDAASSSIKVLPYPSSKAVAPIPLLDVQLSGIPQNLGY